MQNRYYIRANTNNKLIELELIRIFYRNIVMNFAITAQLDVYTIKSCELQ